MSRFDHSAGTLELGGARVLVVGLGKSGDAAARLAQSLGADVHGTDLRGSLPAAPYERTLGEHPTALLGGCELIVLSPGVPATTPLLQDAREREIPIWSEIELAWRVCDGGVIAVTGSNGKSTVTTMIGAILTAAGQVGGIGGNLATPFSTMLAQDGPDVTHALELSSFQLETTHTLRADVAVLTNLTPDHLDRYDGMDAYAAAKARLFEMQDDEGVAVYNADDPEWKRFAPHVRGRAAGFSVNAAADAFLDGECLKLRDGGTICTIDELQVVGIHNVANALAAALACREAGVGMDSIRAGLRNYTALPHRLEAVAMVAGVDYYNDSKATNPESAVRAVESFAGRRVWWILGGRDKDGDWSEVEHAVATRNTVPLLVGEAATMLAERLPQAVGCDTIEAAIRHASGRAAAGDVVLLSPACASFDQFPNFEARGEAFRAVVTQLLREGGHA